LAAILKIADLLPRFQDTGAAIEFRHSAVQPTLKQQV